MEIYSFNHFPWQHSVITELLRPQPPRAMRQMPKRIPTVPHNDSDPSTSPGDATAAPYCRQIQVPATFHGFH